MNHVQAQPCHSHPPPPSLLRHHHPQHQQGSQHLTVSSPPDCLLPSQPVILIGNDTVMSSLPSSSSLSSSLCDARQGKDNGGVKSIQQQHSQLAYTVYSTSPSPSLMTSTTADISPSLDRFQRQHFPSQQSTSPASSSQSCSLVPSRLLLSQHQSVNFSVKPECIVTTASSSSPCQSPMSSGGGKRGSSTPLRVVTSATGGGTLLSSSSSDATQFNKCELLIYADDDDCGGDDDDAEQVMDEIDVGRRLSQTPSCPAQQQVHYSHQQLTQPPMSDRLLESTNSVANVMATDLRTHSTTPSSSTSIMTGVGQLPDPCSQQLSIDYANSSRLNSNPATVNASSHSSSGHLSGLPLISHPHAHYPHSHPPAVGLQSTRQPVHNFSASSMISPGSHHEITGSSGPPSSQGIAADFDLVDQLLPGLPQPSPHHLHHHHQRQMAFSGISSANCGISVLPIANNSDHVFSRDHLHPATPLPSAMEGVAKSRRYSLPYELLICSDGNNTIPTTVITATNGNSKMPVTPGNQEMLEHCGTQISPASSSVVTKSSLSKFSDPNSIVDDGDQATSAVNHQRVVRPLDFVTFHHHPHGNEVAAVVNGTSRCFSTPTVTPLGVAAGRGTGAELLQHPVFDPQCHNEVDLPGFSSPESAFYQYQHRMEGQRCQVCGELAAGFHHGAYVCEACKKFFMRHSVTDTKPTNVCPTGGNCVVAKGSRGKCQICRYRKCLLVGMRMKDPETQPEVDISNIPCRVCGGRSSGFHFGALTCEGCKGFFRRTEGAASALVCVGGQNACTITPRSRNACKSCRFRRCLSAGMSKKGSRIGRQPNAVKFHCAIEIRQLQNVRGKLPLHTLSSGESLATPGSSNSTPYHMGSNAPGCLSSTYPSDLGVNRPSSLQNRAAVGGTAGILSVDDDEEEADVGDVDDHSPRYSPEHRHRQNIFPIGFSQQLHQPQQHPGHHGDNLLPPWLLPTNSVAPAAPTVSTTGFLGDQKPPVTASLFLLLPPPSGQLSESVAVDMATSAGSSAAAAASQCCSPDELTKTTGENNPPSVRLISPSHTTGFAALCRSTTKDEPMTPVQQEYPTDALSGNTSIGECNQVAEDDFEEAESGEQPPHTVTNRPPVGLGRSFDSPSPSTSIPMPSLLAPFGYYYRHYYQQQQQQQQQQQHLVDWRHANNTATSTVHHHHHQQGQHQVAMTASLVAGLARRLTSDADHGDADDDATRVISSPLPNQEAILRFSDGMRTATEFLRLPNTYFKTRFRMTSIPLDREESSCRIWGHMMNHFHMHAQQIVQFAKLIPGFNQLGITARSSLVRGGMYPVVLLLLSRDYKPESDEYNYFDFTSGERAVIMRHFPTFLRFTEHLRMAGLLLHHLSLNLPELSLASAVEVLRNHHILEEPARASTKELFILAYHTLKTCIARRTNVTSSSGADDQHRWDQFLALSKMIQAMNREHHQILADLKESRPDLHFPELYIEMFQLADSASALFAANCSSVKAAVANSLVCSTAVAALKLCTTGEGTGLTSRATDSCDGGGRPIPSASFPPRYSPLNGDSHHGTGMSPTRSMSDVSASTTDISRSHSACPPTSPLP